MSDNKNTYEDKNNQLIAEIQAEIKRIKPVLEPLIEEKKNIAERLKNENIDLEEKREAEARIEEINKEIKTKMKNLMDIEEELLNFNSGFLNKICRKYIVTTGFEDALQEAKLEFLKAATKFDVSKGFKFSTFSSTYIRNKMIKLENEYNKFNKFNKKLNEALNAFEAEGNFSPSYAELVYKMKMSDFDFAIMYLNMSQLSIDDQFREHRIGDYTTKIVDIIRDETVDLIQDSINRETRFSLYKGLKTQLTERELYFLIKHHVNKVTLEELGEEYGLTRERVRQIINNALKKLRSYLERRIGSNCRDENFTLY